MMQDIGYLIVQLIVKLNRIRGWYNGTFICLQKFHIEDIMEPGHTTWQCKMIGVGTNNCVYHIRTQPQGFQFMRPSKFYRDIPRAQKYILPNNELFS